MIVHVLNRRARNNRELEDGEIIINNPNHVTRSSRRVLSQPIITSYEETDKNHTSWSKVFTINIDEFCNWWEKQTLATIIRENGEIL